MLIKGSCHCSKVKFELESPHPYPFNLCYCSICRKTAGGGGYAINLSGRFNTLKISGEENTRIYHAKINGKVTNAERHFCMHCATFLWLYDSRWPELVHPFASAIDAELPSPPERTHLMTASKANWVDINQQANDKCFAEYPDESIAQWHQRHQLEC